MGTTLTSIHVYGETVPRECGLEFRSFSSGWLTCVDELCLWEDAELERMVRRLSKGTDAPVLLFSVYDSEAVWFSVFQNGKQAARYSDDELTANKKLYDIPGLLGCGEGQKRRLSAILACGDTDLKIEMLEEYFGLCLLFEPELLDEPEALYRQRGQDCFRRFQEAERKLTGKAAPIRLKPVAEYPGKLFWDWFGGRMTVKPHCYLWGYKTDEAKELRPVRFGGEGLEVLNIETFGRDRVPKEYEDPRFVLDYGTPCRVTFSEACPASFRGRTMTLPAGCYPVAFTQGGELLLEGRHRLAVVDASLKIIAKLPIKGDFADMVGDHILTTVGESFYAYCYDPGAKIVIYKMVRK